VIYFVALVSTLNLLVLLSMLGWVYKQSQLVLSVAEGVLYLVNQTPEAPEPVQMWVAVPNETRTARGMES
jgi:hypothetical protein